MGNIADELMITTDSEAESRLLSMELVEEFEGVAGIGTLFPEEKVLQITFSDGVVPLDMDLDHRKMQIAARMLKRVQEAL